MIKLEQVTLFQKGADLAVLHLFVIKPQKAFLAKL